MTRADLDLAVERHATSKLDGDDLLQIGTLGFRGEALPSIGAVARLDHHHAPRRRAERLGDHRRWRREVGDQARGAVAKAPASRCKDLFYATPARLKFLKSDRSEAEAVREVVRRLAMSRPDVAFTLASEERAPVTWPAALPGAPGGSPGSPTCWARSSAPMRSRSRAERDGVVVEGYAGLPTLTAAPTRSGNICSSTAARCATSS